jgi:transposase-like protein
MPRPGPRTTYKYSERFKATAVRLSQLRGVSVQDVAESLYIHAFMLAQRSARGKDHDEGVQMATRETRALSSVRWLLGDR